MCDHKPNENTKPRPLTVSRPELLVDGSDTHFRRLVHNLFGFAARHEAIRDGHGALIGLAGIEYTVLISIAHLQHNQNVSVKTVAEHLHVSGAFITRIVNKLIGMRLLEKVVNASDRRRVDLTLAQNGWALLRDLAPVQQQVNDIEFEPLSREEFLLLLDLSERLVRSGEKAVAFQRYLATRTDELS